MRGESGTQLGLGLDVRQVGEIRTYQFVFPFLPPSKNQYDSWQGPWKSSAKAKWIKHTARIADELGVTDAGFTRIGLSARLVFPTNQRRDPQNYAQTLWHFFPDALQRCGVLVDDRDGAIDWGPNLGLQLHVDNRPGKAKTSRKRTIVIVSARVLPDRTSEHLERG